MLILTPTTQNMALGAEQTILFRENGESLAQWEPLTFPKIKAHSTHTLVKEEGKYKRKKPNSQNNLFAGTHREDPV